MTPPDRPPPEPGPPPAPGHVGPGPTGPDASTPGPFAPGPFAPGPPDPTGGPTVVATSGPPGVPGGLAAPYLPPAPRARRRPGGLWAVVALLGVVLVVAGGVVAVRAYQGSLTPQAAVRAYFAALARGDARGALAAGAVPAGGRDLVTDAVLGSTLAAAPVDRVETGTVVVDGDAGSVAVRYRLGGTTPQEVDDVVAVVRHDGRWSLRRTAVPLTLTVGSAASWAAVPSPTPFALPEGTQLVFPGAVPVLFRTVVLEPAAATRVVRMDGTDEAVQVGAEVSDAGRLLLTAATRTALTACSAGGTGVDPFCPQPPAGTDGPVVLRAVPQSFSGTLQRLDRLDPTFDVAADAAGTVTVTGSVAAAGAWQVLDFDNLAQARDGATTITFTARVPVADPRALTWDRG